jgi:hypothetical protein
MVLDVWDDARKVSAPLRKLAHTIHPAGALSSSPSRPPSAGPAAQSAPHIPPAPSSGDAEAQEMRRNEVALTKEIAGFKPSYCHKLVAPYRVSLKELSKKKQYQVGPIDVIFFFYFPTYLD